ncbi:DUF4221 family protein [Belliella kenyensis]|uniref:DUF4221 family protein n=1 Tax=Belliella kenyensis TaxID=1472724 RepID=A0ABV8EIM6_9BACT|nr:DUF4221 family protein [Belliella kenyensis]MCH7401374.1 DUF4221 domain-containing protein [Belliella kenyensis]MDN3602817.1 DUF4221 family protein [Belliella kenyensis]
MKNLYLIILSILVVSCGKSGDALHSSSFDDITISMDTVIVDSKDQILMAATSSYGYSYSDDLDKLFYWDGSSASMEIIDLDLMELVEKKGFEKEGPNGVGQYAYSSKYINDEIFAVGEWNEVKIIDFDGKVKKRIKLEDDWIKEKLDESESLTPLVFSSDGKFMYCAITNFSKINSNIVEVDLENNTTKIFELPEFDKRENFRVTFKYDGGGMSMYAPWISTLKNNGKIIFTSDAFSNMYVYDHATDSVTFEMITYKLTPNEKMGTYPKEVHSPESFQEEMNKINQEISFSLPLWDDKNKVFYRFSHYTKPKLSDDEEAKYNVFLSILDQSFEVVGEKDISEHFKSRPQALFVKDGLIYNYLNVDDELGFVRVKIN